MLPLPPIPHSVPGITGRGSYKLSRHKQQALTAASHVCLACASEGVFQAINLHTRMVGATGSQQPRHIVQKTHLPVEEVLSCFGAPFFTSQMQKHHCRYGYNVPRSSAASRTRSSTRRTTCDLELCSPTSPKPNPTMQLARFARCVHSSRTLLLRTSPRQSLSPWQGAKPPQCCCIAPGYTATRASHPEGLIYLGQLALSFCHVFPALSGLRESCKGDGSPVHLNCLTRHEYIACNAFHMMHNCRCKQAQCPGGLRQLRKPKLHELRGCLGLQPCLRLNNDKTLWT